MTTFHPLTFPEPKARINLCTTARLALQANACRGAFNKVVTGLWSDQLDKSKTDHKGRIMIPENLLDAPISILEITHLSSIKDALWALGNCIADEDRQIRDKISRLMGAEFGAIVLENYEKEFPGDNRVRNTLIVAHKFANGEATEAELSEAGEAAWSAARSAESAARSIWSATWSASSAALSAHYAAWSSADFAAESAAESVWSANQDMEKFEEAQIKIMQKYLV